MRSYSLPVSQSLEKAQGFFKLAVFRGFLAFETQTERRFPFRSNEFHPFDDTTAWFIDPSNDMLKARQKKASSNPEGFEEAFDFMVYSQHRN